MMVGLGCTHFTRASDVALALFADPFSCSGTAGSDVQGSIEPHVIPVNVHTAGSTGSSCCCLSGQSRRIKLYVSVPTDLF